MHPVAGYGIDNEMPRVLYTAIISGQYDIGKQGNFRVSQGRTVDAGDDRRLDIQQVHHQLLAVPADTFPLLRVEYGEFEVFRRRAGKCIARSGHDYHAHVRITGNLAEQLRQFVMHRAAPEQRATISMKGDLQQAVVEVDFCMVKIGFHIFLPCSIRVLCYPESEWNRDKLCRTY